MNKLLRSLALLLCACTSLYTFAQHEVKFGYCNDELSPRYEFVANENQQEFTFGCAILIPSSRLQMLKGQKITRMRFACSKGIKSCYAWAKSQLNKLPIAKVYSVGTTVEGWNEVTFEEPIEITGDDLYIGYSGKVPNGGAIFFDGAVNPNGVFMLENGEWSDWSTNGCRPLCIQAFATLDSDVPLVDLGIEKVTFTSPYTQKGNDVQASVQIGNYGETTVDAPKMFYSVNGADPVAITTSGSINTNSSATFNFSVPTTTLEEGKVPLRVWAETDENYKGNDTLSTEMLVYSNSYPHKVLCEHFTTLECVNCPVGHDALKEVFKGKYNYVWVAHHIGYYTDELTQQASYDLEKFGATQAPLAMFDRRVLSASTSSTKPVFGINWGTVAASTKAISPAFESCASTPAFVSVNIKNSYNAETRELTTTVSGERNKLFPVFYDNTILTVELVEDSVQTKSGQNNTNERIHSNVFRQAITRTLGDEMVWNGDNYSETYTVSIPEEYNAKNVRVVAFVSLPTTDTSHADVLNANELNINAVETTGINQVTTNDVQVLNRTFYNMQGQRINRPTMNGAYLERIETTQGVQTVKRIK